MTPGNLLPSWFGGTAPDVDTGQHFWSGVFRAKITGVKAANVPSAPGGTLFLYAWRSLDVEPGAGWDQPLALTAPRFGTIDPDISPAVEINNTFIDPGENGFNAWCRYRGVTGGQHYFEFVAIPDGVAPVAIPPPAQGSDPGPTYLLPPTATFMISVTPMPTAGVTYNVVRVTGNPGGTTAYVTVGLVNNPVSTLTTYVTTWNTTLTTLTMTGYTPATIPATPGTSSGNTYTFTGAPGGSTSISTTGTGGQGGGTLFTTGPGGTAGSATNQTGGQSGPIAFAIGTPGGATSTTGSNDGGDGGPFTFTGSSGASVSSAGTANTGGDGTPFTFSTGSGGNSSGGSGPQTGGSAGGFTFTGTTGGTASTSGTNNTGGVGTDFTFMVGSGGPASGGSGTSTGGRAGGVTWTGANGGAASGSGTVNVGGDGTGYTFTAGNGGAATNGGTSNTGGDGGDFTFSAGTGGSGATTTGSNGGMVFNVGGSNQSPTPDAFTFSVAGQTALQITSAGISGVPKFTKFTKSFTDFTPSGPVGTDDIELYAAPARTFVLAAFIRTTTAWDGPSISQASFAVFGTATGSNLLAGYDGLAAPGNTNYASNPPTGGGSGFNALGVQGTLAATSIRLELAVNGCDLEDLTAGAIEVELLLSVLP